MLNGTPCIATNWSANTEFMNKDVACMVDYKMVELDHEVGPYKKGSHWAEPNVEQAAEYMKLLRVNQDKYCKMSIVSKEYIEERLSMKRLKELIESRVAVIEERG